MLLFLIGVDLPTLLLLSILLIIAGLFIFRLARGILRKTLSGTSEKKINALSRICAVILLPLFLFGTLALLIYAYSETAPIESAEEIISNHYKMMEEDLAEDLKVGMSRREVIERFGESDTTQSLMVYDLTGPNAKEKYILEVSFEKGRLTGYRRKPIDAAGVIDPNEFRQHEVLDAGKPTSVQFDKDQDFEVLTVARSTSASPASDTAMCKGWTIEKQHIRKIIKDCEPISGPDWHHLFDVLPCAVTGEIIQNGLTYEFEINAGSWVLISSKDNALRLGSFEKKNEKHFLSSPITHE